MDVNNITALQGLYVALGGDIADVANITTTPDMLEAIATVAHAAATELPVVTSADEGDILTVDATGTWSKGAAPTELPTVSSTDNGDVLTVVEGAWAKAAVPTELPTVTGDDNGSDLIVANSVWSKSYPLSIVAVAHGVQSDFPTCIASLSANDRKNAFLEMVKQGKIIFQFSGDYYAPVKWNTSGGDYRFYFDASEVSTDYNMLMYMLVTVSVGTSNKISCTQVTKDYTLTPYS